MFLVAALVVVVFSAGCAVFYSSIPKEIVGNIIPFLVVIFSAFCAFVSGVISAKMASKREDRKDIVRTATSFCDELMNDASQYWVSKCSDKNKIEMGVLRKRVTSYIILICLFLNENFPDNSDIEQAVEQVNEFVGGLNFDSSNRESDSEKSMQATYHIIQLRLIVSKYKEQNSYDSFKRTMIKFFLKKKFK